MYSILSYLYFVCSEIFAILFHPFKTIICCIKSYISFYYSFQSLRARPTLIIVCLVISKWLVGYSLLIKFIYSEKATNIAKPSPYFWLQYRQSIGGRCRKILWPSQNIWTLLVWNVVPLNSSCGLWMLLNFGSNIVSKKAR